MKQGRWAIAAVSMVLGIMLVTQYRMTQTITENNVHLQRAGDLALQLNAAQKERDELRAQLEKIKKGTTDDVNSDYSVLKQRAGLTTVSGTGVVVTNSGQSDFN